MALEAVVFSQDPLSYNCCTSTTTNNNTNFGFNYDYFIPNYYPSKLEETSLKPPFTSVELFDTNNNFFDFPNNDTITSTTATATATTTTTTTTASELMFENNVVPHWSDQTQQQQYVAPSYSSPEEHLYLSGEAQPPPPPLPYTPTAAVVGGTRRKRRRRSCKNKEEVEQQRMTHIAVERNRRKQMNEYLAVIRSLMPSSYVQRGDQASIVGGAINYVKELEQALQSVEAQKHRRLDHHHHSPPASDGHHKNEDCKNDESLDSCTTEGTTEAPPPPELFAEFFSFPQYTTRCTTNSSPTRSSGCNSVSSSNSGVGEIEVTMVESHANVKILAKKQTKQLVKLIAGFQGLRLNVLHLNVTTVDSFVLYSFSLKVEEGCQLHSVDDIAVAANHILGQIQEEAADHLHTLII